MKQFFFIFFFFTISFANASELKSIVINNTTLYHHVCAAEKSNKSLILFLHGSVSAYQGQTESRPAELNALLENNSVFLPTFNKEGFDVVLPIAYNEFNWLDSSGDQYLKALIELYKNKYQQLYLAGFSDGGTGAYKYFNKHPEAFSGVILFNSYPQHKNFYKQVDYQKIQGKKMFFIAQDRDKVTPYEFPLVAYRRHKIMNDQTYFLLEKGQHEFLKYDPMVFNKIIRLLKEVPKKISTASDSITIYPPIDGYIKNDTLLETYTFRKSIGKSYGMRATEYMPQPKELSKYTKQGSFLIHPLKIKRSDLNKESFTFKGQLDGSTIEVKLINYLVLPAW